MARAVRVGGWVEWSVDRWNEQSAVAFAMPPREKPNRGCNDRRERDGGKRCAHHALWRRAERVERA